MRHMSVDNATRERIRAALSGCVVPVDRKLSDVEPLGSAQRHSASAA